MLKNGGDLKHIILFSIERMNENDKEETMKKILKIFLNIKNYGVQYC